MSSSFSSFSVEEACCCDGTMVKDVIGAAWKGAV